VVLDLFGKVAVATLGSETRPPTSVRQGFPQARFPNEPSTRAQAAGGGQTPPPVTLPVAFSAFPGEIFQAPRTWVQGSYPTLMYYSKPDRGGHFAAWEEPQLFTEELRAAFRSLR
jgi:hypothetical protein